MTNFQAPLLQLNTAEPEYQMPPPGGLTLLTVLFVPCSPPGAVAWQVYP